MKKEVRFENSYPPLELEEGTSLSEVLNADNSPILFGCRTGICGTCLVSVSEIQGELPPATLAEMEYFEMMGINNPHVRLACQMNLTTHLCLKKYKI